ncbi:MBL fold metallo-hydrolase [Tianweitania sediminis]|uniref:MBL fold metallo-hydrolase n=1 Tax=Tianweitania sediminis TaxID=1502156 RepID=A0A8J7UIB3_9HYPH|nr:MBL fold metallo-hydrolase [Tianweitania sediminis]MBP0438723.1 MBL fold metallo-hydrolase [Tianweitania sediminis]
MLGSIDRRTLFKAGAFAGTAALAAPQLMTRAAFAAAPQKPEVGNAGFHRFTLGNFEVTVILDGMRPGDGPHPTFGANQPAEEVEALMVENFLPPKRMVNMFNPVLVNTGSELILFDTGMGPAGREAGLGQLTRRMADSGYSPSDVTTVVITHMHGDHINGLMEGDQPAFIGARYVAGQTEYDFWTSPDRAGTPAEGNAKAVQSKVVPLKDKMTFIEDNAQVAPGITAMAATGHTPGHMVFMLESEGRNLLLTADTANHFVASLQRPDWEVSFDMNKEQAAETRKRIFGMLASDRMPFIGYHMPHPSVGFVEPLDTGFRFVPATYQFAV